ncbi:MAG: hydantoinase B/oxoprolinase family protein [Hyphomicrobiales bacterium]
MDPVTLAVVRGGFEQIGDEMDLHLIHAAISPIISETNDCANGIFHPVTGETIAQGRYGLPVFLAYMQFVVQNLIKLVEAEGGFKDGDIWITNDPYFGGSHLQDVQLVAPYFVDGKLFALMSNTGHWMDIGGNVPGGWAPKAQEIHQEGLIIPPVKLYEGGKLNTALVKMFRANVRLPDQIAGDLAAMANVFAVGRRGLDGLIARYGAATVNACQAEMISRSERQMRSHIAEIPDGVYTCADSFDNDGIVDEPIPIRLSVTVNGGAMHLDFTGTAGRTRGPFNISRNTTLSTCYVALKHIFPDVPINGGTFRPITFTVPDGSMLAAEYPAAVGAYLEPVGRILDLIFGALSKAIPDRVPAPFFGTTGPCSVSGVHPRSKSYFVGVFPYPGGYGASKQSDGLVNGNPPQSMANFMSLELSEHRFPLRFDYFALREDSGGAGQHRGGCGTAYGFTVWSDTTVSCLGDRADTPPFGIAGGGAAKPNVVEFRTGGKSWRPEFRGKQEKQLLHKGEGMDLKSPGGGGFGDPLTREIEAVESDLNLGYISRRTAEEDYGVVITGVTRFAGYDRFRLDPAATARRRSQLRDSGQPSRHKLQEA